MIKSISPAFILVALILPVSEVKRISPLESMLLATIFVLFELIRISPSYEVELLFTYNVSPTPFIYTFSFASPIALCVLKVIPLLEVVSMNKSEL